MPIILAFVLGLLVYHYYPTEVEGVTKQANAAVHVTASKVAKATEPTLYEQAKQKIEEMTK